MKGWRRITIGAAPWLWRLSASTVCARRRERGSPTHTISAAVLTNTTYAATEEEGWHLTPRTVAAWIGKLT